jgi:hypothetical protein
MNVRMHSYEHTHHPPLRPLPSREEEIYEVLSPLGGDSYECFAGLG